ncbi:MAG: hypothetical protein R3F35_20120 [Myxococcota bacterium]
MLPGPFAPLGPSEGFLVVHVETDVAIERLHADSRLIGQALPPGEHLWLVRMKAGRHRWSRIRLVSQAGGESGRRPESKGVLNEQEFTFDVEAGAINYPGAIVVAKFDPGRVLIGIPWWSILTHAEIRNRNHSAMALRSLAKTHPALLAAHPIRYAGRSGDRFLQFYTRERGKLARPDAFEGEREMGR